MKTLMQNKTVTKAVTIALFLAVFFVPTLTVIADESGDVSDAGGDSFYSAYDNDMWPTVGEVFDVGGDTAVEVPVSDAGGDTRYEEVTEIAYVYEETTYPYYYGGYSGFSAGYSVEYPTYRDRPYTYTNYETRSPSPVCTLTVNQTSIDEGDDVRLSWTTSNATSISINNGVGTVSGSGSVTVSPSSSRTYVLVANGAGGSVWCSETVTVDEDNGSNNGNARCDSFTASDTRVEEGDEITLRWRTTNADDVRINQGVGDVDDDGSEEVTIDEDTTFTLTARDGSDTDTCRVTVRVEDDNNSSAPRCTFHVSDTSIARGGSTILSWNNDRTERITLKDSSGTTIADSDDDRDIDEDRDALTVRPNKSTTYTLSVYNGNTRRTCTLDVNVGGQIAGGISLSQVPYTGFSAGPVLTAIFYGAIVVWGLILAYVLVIRKRDEAVVAEEQDWSLEDVDSVEVDSIEENTVPENLPIMAEEVVSDEEAFQSLEAYAHEHSALISSDALRFIAGQGDSDTERTEILGRVIDLAKARYPKEGDWVIINKERVLTVLA